MERFVETHPHLQAKIDSSLYFVRFDLHEPKDGSSSLRLGNWVELQTEFDRNNGVQPSCSKENYDAGLFNPRLAPPEECTSNMRVAVLDVQQWPVKAVMNFQGEFVL